MKKKYFESEGELGFRFWMFALAVEDLKKNPNPEKQKKLVAKMQSFKAVVGETGDTEQLKDIKQLIKELE